MKRQSSSVFCPIEASKFVWRFTQSKIYSHYSLWAILFDRKTPSPNEKRNLIIAEDIKKKYNEFSVGAIKVSKPFVVLVCKREIPHWKNLFTCVFANVNELLCCAGVIEITKKKETQRGRVSRDCALSIYSIYTPNSFAKCTNVIFFK